jgi:hypothetical protein
MTVLRFWLRRLGLAGSGATFAFIGVASVFAPNQVAARYAYALGSADALNEFHAIFTGFWLGLAALMLTAARHPEDRRLGDLCGIAIGLQALARAYSSLVHGVPAPSFTSAMVGELATALAILQGSSVTGVKR